VTAFIIAPLMFFGFLTAILGKIHFFLGVIPAVICYILLNYLVLVIEMMAKIPFAFVQF
jgi:DMSO/TMAO reductase YedYZ heme-binding membrane subunit